MIILWSVLVFIVAAVGMEFVAWATHKYVMHGFLWVLHEDHHRPSGRGLQKNDLFAVFFAAIAIGLIYQGTLGDWGILAAAAGFGVTLYGIGYTLFHDIMFHRRIRAIRYRPQRPYMRRIIRAHRVHHRHGNKEDSSSFGFLYAPPKYDEPTPSP
jgi:beta-carotene 3-hydroxylase